MSGTKGKGKEKAGCWVYEGVALALQPLPAGFVQGRDHPGLPRSVEPLSERPGSTPAASSPWGCLHPRGFLDSGPALPAESLLKTYLASVPDEDAQLAQLSAKERLGRRSLFAVLHRVGGRGVTLSVFHSAHREIGPYKVPEATAVENSDSSHEWVYPRDKEGLGIL